MKRRMAWVMDTDHLEIRESELSQLKEDEILIKTAYSAICGSDMHLYHNRHPFVKVPCTIGHELSGVVVAVGKNVKKIEIGDHVVPEPILICGKCEHCLHGNYHMCEEVSYGYRKGQAGFGDYYICSEHWAHKLPSNVPLNVGALVEPLSVAIHGVEKAGDIFGKTVVVFGAGAIGAFAAVVCKSKGAGKIFIVDTNEYRLKIAGEGIAESVISSKDNNAVDYIFDKTKGSGADVVLECTGVEICIKQALDVVKKMGTIVQIGIPSRPLSEYNYSRILSKEIMLRGAQGYCFNFEQAISMLRNGLDISRYITNEYYFERINDAFKTMAVPNAAEMKIVISYEV